MKLFRAIIWPLLAMALLLFYTYAALELGRTVGQIQCHLGISADGEANG